MRLGQIPKEGNQNFQVNKGGAFQEEGEPEEESTALKITSEVWGQRVDQCDKAFGEKIPIIQGSQSNRGTGVDNKQLS